MLEQNGQLEKVSAPKELALRMILEAEGASASSSGTTPDRAPF
jgi:hypothetical protein